MLINKEERLESQLTFLRIIDREKQVFRQTLLLDGSRCENDAEHSWHMAVCTMLLYEYCDERESLSMEKVLRMTLLHDLVEIYAGDTYAYDAGGNQSKLHREEDAAQKLFSALPDDQKREFYALWKEFETCLTPEARFARMADTFMPFYHNYITEGRQWRLHGVHIAQVEKRLERIKTSSHFLWTYCRRLLEDAVEKGYLLP